QKASMTYEEPLAKPADKINDLSEPDMVLRHKPEIITETKIPIKEMSQKTEEPIEPVLLKSESYRLEEEVDPTVLDDSQLEEMPPLSEADAEITEPIIDIAYLEL